MRFIKLTILLSLLALAVTFWQRNHLASDMDFSEKLTNDPKQHIVKKKPFTVVMNDTNYYIEPLYDYTLYGMVVSLKQHDGDTGLHKMWNDHLNVADLCVVWSDTAFSSHLSKVEFWNGQFTCFYQTSDRQAWADFNGHQLSNNHLITEDKYLRKKINNLNIGDQIEIQGWLANYQTHNSGKRGTSITRTDTGNGACETIYVNDVRILKEYTSIWRYGMYVALITLLLSIIAYFRAPISTHH